MLVSCESNRVNTNNASNVSSLSLSIYIATKVDKARRKLIVIVRCLYWVWCCALFTYLRAIRLFGVDVNIRNRRISEWLLVCWLTND